MGSKFGRIARIDEEMDKMLREVATENNISIKEASKKIAKMMKAKKLNKKVNIPDEFIF